MENNNVIESAAMPASNINLAGVLSIPAVRQVILLLGVAAAVAVGITVAMWSQSPAYTQLYGDMVAAEAAEVADALRAAKGAVDPAGIMNPGVLLDPSP